MMHGRYLCLQGTLCKRLRQWVCPQDSLSQQLPTFLDFHVRQEMYPECHSLLPAWDTTCLLTVLKHLHVQDNGRDSN